jgi:integrase
VLRSDGFSDRFLQVSTGFQSDDRRRRAQARLPPAAIGNPPADAPSAWLAAYGLFRTCSPAGIEAAKQQALTDAPNHIFVAGAATPPSSAVPEALAPPAARRDALKMVQRRAKAAGIKTKIGNHTFRATGITIYLTNGGDLEKAQQMAAHESPRTTKLYDRRSDVVSLDEVEKVVF